MYFLCSTQGSADFVDTLLFWLELKNAENHALNLPLRFCNMGKCVRVLLLFIKQKEQYSKSPKTFKSQAMIDNDDDDSDSHIRSICVCMLHHQHIYHIQENVQPWMELKCQAFE